MTKKSRHGRAGFLTSWERRPRRSQSDAVPAMRLVARRVSVLRVFGVGFVFRVPGGATRASLPQSLQHETRRCVLAQVDAERAGFHGNRRADFATAKIHGLRAG